MQVFQIMKYTKERIWYFHARCFCHTMGGNHAINSDYEIYKRKNMVFSCKMFCSGHANN